MSVRQQEFLRPLNISLVSSLLHPKFGGPAEVLRLHALGLRNTCNLTIYGITSHKERDHLFDRYPSLRLFEPRFPNRWFYGKGLQDALINETKDSDVIHAHMIWDYPVFASWRSAITNDVPLIISPHGSLNNVWRYSGFHKQVYRKCILDKIFNETTCVHVLNQEEELACRNYGIKCPIQIIPNGLPAEYFYLTRSASAALERWPELSGRRIMLYLGRLWHGKGLDILLKAWTRVRDDVKNRDWILVIAGPDYNNYKKTLEKGIADLDLNSYTLLTGPVYGDLKESLLEASTAYVLPSHGEGFSMALLEAAAAKLPVLFTDKCNFTELANCGGGWEVSNTDEGLIRALKMILNENDNYLTAAGHSGWTHVKGIYSLDKIANRLVNMYKEAGHSF